MELSDLMRSRVDFNTLNDGRIEAILTLTLGPDLVRRFRAVASPDELGEVEIGASSPGLHPVSCACSKHARYPVSGLAPVEIGALYKAQLAKFDASDDKQARDLAWEIVRLEKKTAPSVDTDSARQKWWMSLKPAMRVKHRRRLLVYRGMTKKKAMPLATWAAFWIKQPELVRSTFYNKYAPESRGVLGEIAHGVKEVASSKVFQIAAGALATAVPVIGPIAGPSLIAASATLGTSAKLIDASLAARGGNTAKAARLTEEAKTAATRLTKTPAAAAALLQLANDKRKNVAALAAGKPMPRPPSKPSSSSSGKAVPISSSSGAAVLKAAQAGRLRSNRPGTITPAALLQAHKTGRVFWIAQAS